MNVEVREELESRIDALERDAGAAFSNPLTAMKRLPSLVADLIDVLRGVVEAMGEHDDG